MRAYCDPRGNWLATRQWAKSGPPPFGWLLAAAAQGKLQLRCRGCPVKARRSVATLVRATSPRCTPLLPANLHRAITVGLPSREGL